MPAQKKVDLKDEYAQLLEEYPDFILTRYLGLNVGKMSDLRRGLLQKQSTYRVVKNNIFKMALKESGKVPEFPLDDTFHGPIGVAFVREDVPSVAKELDTFSKDNEKFSIISGVMESKYYDQAGIQAIANLPTREQSLATLASALNSPARNIAGLMNQIMSSLARGIKAVGEKNG